MFTKPSAEKPKNNHVTTKRGGGSEKQQFLQPKTPESMLQHDYKIFGKFLNVILGCLVDDFLCFCTILLGDLQLEFQDFDFVVHAHATCSTFPIEFLE